MPGKVFFASVRAHGETDNKVTKIRKLFESAGFGALVKKDDLVAIKLHFGELGCDAYIRPPFVRQVVDKVKENGGKPFLTDSATLYSGSRANAVDHIWTAAEHGFDLAFVGAPVIIADGLRSTNVSKVEISKKHFKTVSIASDIVTSDALIAMSHFKGHMQAGFGGAIKNLAMGCAPPAGKRDQHGSRAIFGDNCQGCATCLKVCPSEAITMVSKKAKVDRSKCSGCGECITVCPNHNIEFDWETDAEQFGESLVEYALGAITNKKDHCGFFNFLLSVSPECDCVPWSDAPIVPDIGILASTDPVAVDKASYDLVNRQVGFQNSALKTSHAAGADKFKDIWPRIDGSIQFRHAEKIGLGSADYKLIEL